MSFNVYTEKGEAKGSGSDVDWDGRAKYLVETAQLTKAEVLVGTISGIYDLGIQAQDDGKMESKLTPEEEAEEIEKNPNCYFENAIDYNDGKKEKRYKRFPLKDEQSIAITVDFPDIMVDQAPFFGKESNPRPLRMLLGGEFNPKGSKEKIVARPLGLGIRKNDKTYNKWSMLPNTLLYKMAVAGGVIIQGEPFLPQDDLSNLLGKSMQFKAKLELNDGKYLNESCQFVGALARGQVAKELDESLHQLIQFTVENDPNDLTELRGSIKNTMKRAKNWPLDSTILRKQLEGDTSPTEEGDEKGSEEDEVKDPIAKNKPPVSKKSTPRKIIEDEVEDEDEEDPFAEE